MCLPLLVKVSTVGVRSAHGDHNNWLLNLCGLLLRPLLYSACCGILVDRRDASDPPQVRLAFVLAHCIGAWHLDLAFLRLNEVIVPRICIGSNRHLGLWLRPFKVSPRSLLPIPDPTRVN